MKWTNKGHELDDISSFLINKKHCYLWGAGTYGRHLLAYIEKLRAYIEFDITLLDKNADIQRQGLNGLPVYSPDLLNNSDTESSFVIIGTSSITNPCAVDTIKESAQKAGYVLNKNLFDYEYFLYTCISVYFLYKYNKVYFSSLSVLPSTICNLNCKACLNFNPYIKKHTTYTLEEMKNGINLLFSKVDLIGRFQITGGEPLLYKDIENLVEYIGSNFRKQIVFFEIVTNGTVVPSDKLCELLRRYDICVHLDDYRMSVEKAKKIFDVIKNKLVTNGISVEHRFANNEKWISLVQDSVCKETLDTKVLEKKFFSCECPWTTLAGNAISSCNYSLYAYKAGIIDYCSEDYLDLSTINENNKAELVEFRCRFNERGYVELCKKCNGFYKINPNSIPAAEQVERAKRGVL